MAIQTRTIALIAAFVVVFLSEAGAKGPSPKRLETMSLEELMAVHVDEHIQVNRDALKKALRAKLRDVPTPDLFCLRKEANAEPLNCIDFIYPPLQEQIKENTLVVYAKVTKVEHEREDLIRDILSRSMGNTRIHITLDVLGQFPKEPPRKTLTYTTSESWEYVNCVQQDSLNAFVFAAAGDELRGGSVTDIYPAHGDVVERVVPGANMTLDEMWKLVATQYDLVTAGGAGTQERVNAWLEKLGTGTLSECVAAMNLLCQIKDIEFDAKPIVDVVERQYQAIETAVHQGQVDADTQTAMRDFQSLATAAVAILTRLAEPDSVTRMYELYMKDTSSNEFLNPDRGLESAVVAMVAAVPGPRRIDRLERMFGTSGMQQGPGNRHWYNLYEQRHRAMEGLAKVQGDDIDALLLAMNKEPETYGLLEDSEIGTVWSVLGERGNMAIRPTLEAAAADTNKNPRRGEYARNALRRLSAFMPEEEALSLMFAQYEEGDKNAIHDFCKRANPDSEFAQAFLLKVDMNDISYYIRTRLANPAFIPPLEKASIERCNPQLMWALDACGGREQAVRTAIRGLEQEPDITKDTLQKRLNELNAYAGFLAYVGSPEAVPALRRMAKSETFDHYRELAREFWSDRSPDNREGEIRCVSESVLMALASCGGSKVTPILRHFHKKGTERERFIAAWGLYALGNDLGIASVRAYAERQVEYNGRVPLNVLRSERSDAVLLERLRNGLNYGDVNLLHEYTGEGETPSRFAREYERQLLPLMLGYLEAPDSLARSVANTALCILTGQKMQFDVTASPEKRAEAVQGWREQVEQYRARSTPKP